MIYARLISIPIIHINIAYLVIIPVSNVLVLQLHQLVQHVMQQKIEYLLELTASAMMVTMMME
jgi:hypothetical protein